MLSSRSDGGKGESDQCLKRKRVESVGEETKEEGLGVCQWWVIPEVAPDCSFSWTGTYGLVDMGAYMANKLL